MWTSEKKSNPAMDGPSSTSFFAPGFRMIGDIDSSNDIRVEGIIQGNLTTTKKVIIGKTGQIIGNVKASHISILGEVVGEVVATDITIIGETGVVHGSVLSNKIKIETGAEVEACIKKYSENKEMNKTEKEDNKSKIGKIKDNSLHPQLMKESIEN
ncbi:bactofilin family protein [Cyclobacterium plantarum]|uniref:Polymer-forming cytoskeletal protein n=1 Tax=Cyclobacterium plantarum TaxID=2716263 RepID=A0ABX0HF05_9BACT|nr:polymer-forming cytoskeletal protein [Cyclobacterium plantarum]NHE59543.1 polymer-forming cytoskeletal protein [Cyclobacterium plantarum]